MAGTQTGEYFRILPGVSLFYLPLPLGIVLINWWGPRVLTGFILNSIVSAIFWGFKDPISILFLSTHQMFTILLSWLLCRFLQIDTSLRNTHHLISYLIFGLVIPVTFNSTYALLFGGSRAEPWTEMVIIWFVDFFTVFVITLPLFVLLTPLLARKGWLAAGPSGSFGPVGFSTAHWLEVGAIALGFIIVSQTLDFEKYWFIYGAGSMIASVRLGFNAIVILNLCVYLITYLLPFFSLVNSHVSTDDMRLVNLHIGMSLLSASATVIGRVITDLKEAKEEQLKANRQLKIMNQELDSFVYSVSHDLSAPLKSVQGLINIMRLEKDYSKTPAYLQMIEKSVNKLEQFIQDVLEYSRSSRKKVSTAVVELKPLLDEILDNHRFMDSFSNIDFSFNLAEPVVTTDRLLVKTILSNLISNAIKYQKGNGQDQAWVEVSSRRNGKFVEITVADNGEGIPEKMLPRIFEMFYKGDQVARGSGLGLYIAKAASEKINGRLRVESTYGEGSAFHLQIET